MKKGDAGLTDEQRAELAALAELPEDQIDTTDIPEVLDWTHARRADLYRPIKQQVTLRLDADILAWFKERAPGGRGYQTDINRALREHISRSSGTDASTCLPGNNDVLAALKDGEITVSQAGRKIRESRAEARDNDV